MRRVVILALYVSIGHSSVKAFSGRFSAECSPSYATNTVYSQMKPPFYNTGGAIRMHFGAAYHLFLQEHCGLSIGLSYALGHIACVREASESMPSPIEEAYFLRYIWIPCLVRFYTSEVAIDTSIYVKLGIIPSISLPARSTIRSDSGGPAFLQKRPFGCFVLLGGGIKYDFSPTNSLALGLSYCWDVCGVMYYEALKNRATYCYNNFFCLDLSCLF